MNKNDLYRGIVSCPLKCNDIIRDESSNIPRGFYTKANIGDAIDLMLIAINPGQPMKSQTGKYSRMTSAQKVRVIFASKNFEPPYGKNFHRRLVKWAAYILDVSEEQVFSKAIYTNLVKCTTPGNKTPHKETAYTCFQHHLSNEIRAWNPRAIVALGEKTDKYLRGFSLSKDIYFLPHPSHRKHKNYHKPFVKKIRNAILTKRRVKEKG